MKYFNVPGYPNKNNSESTFEGKHKIYNLTPSYCVQCTKFRCAMLALRNIIPLIIVHVYTYDTLHKIHRGCDFHLVLVLSSNAVEVIRPILNFSYKNILHTPKAQKSTKSNKSTKK